MTLEKYHQNGRLEYQRIPWPVPCRDCKTRRVMMKRTMLIVVVMLLLVPVVLYLAAPELLVEFAIDLERRSAGLSKGSS